MQRKWTKEEIDFAIQCLGKGMSAGATAKSMTEAGIRSDRGPISRNAIIGIWSRNSDAPRSKTPRINLNLKNKRKEADILRNKVFIPKHAIPEEGLDFYDLRPGACRFPFGDPDVESLKYCGHTVDYSKGQSYCTMHYTLCYYPPRKK